jgi:hypothetical protein
VNLKEVAKQIRSLEKKLETLQKQVEKLEAENVTLNEQIASGSAGPAMQESIQKLAENSVQLQKLEAEWLQAAAERDAKSSLN